MENNQKHISEITVLEIIKKYTSGCSLSSLSKSYKLDRKTIRYHLNKHNIKHNELYQKYRPNQYYYDKEFFHNLDTPEKAYIFNLLLADGNVYKNRINITLKYDDLDTIKLVAKLLKTNSPIRKIWRNGHPQGQLIIYCKQMVTDLINLGCVPNKTNKIRFNQLSDNLKPHGLLGYSDGDGSWYISKECDDYQWGILSNKKFCCDVMEYLIDECQLSRVKLKKYKKVWELRYGGRVQISKIWHLLYDNAVVWMPRKKNKLNHIIYSHEEINEIESRRQYIINIEDNVVSAYESGQTLSTMVTKFGISLNLIKRILRDNRVVMDRAKSKRLNVEKAVMEYINGGKPKNICGKFNISGASLFNEIHKMNIALHSPQLAIGK